MLLGKCSHIRKTEKNEAGKTKSVRRRLWMSNCTPRRQPSVISN